MQGRWRWRCSRHRLKWDGVVGDVFGGLRGGCGAVGEIEMPDDGFAGVLHLDGEIAVGGAADEVVVAHGPVAVEAKAIDVDDEDVAGHGGLDEEGASLWVAAHDALLAVEVVASGVDGGGVDGVAGVDGEDGLVEGGELAVEDGGGEVVAFGCG